MKHIGRRTLVCMGVIAIVALIVWAVCDGARCEPGQHDGTKVGGTMLVKGCE